MRKTYFNITECTEEELDELKCTLLYSDEEYIDGFGLNKEDKEEIMKCVYPEDISLELLKKVYGHYAFVDEDFFCNIKEEKTEETENDDLRIEQQGGII